MGINASLAALLVRAKQAGYSFARTATIGRQSLRVPVSELARLARRLPLAEPDWGQFANDGFCEDFLQLFLGAEAISSFDASSYQHATLVHDLNTAIPVDYHEIFDAVIDGGTIEHVFDIKQMLSNYMAMTKIGGHIHICTPANNLCGHGFYQFSPEFFFRVFDETNGFRVNSLCLIETPLHFVEKSRYQKVFEVVDFATVRKRMVIVTDRPVSVYVHATRMCNKPLFAEPPYQTDYSSKWAAHAGSCLGPGLGSEAADEHLREYSFSYVSRWEERRRLALQRRKNSLANRRWFTRIHP